MAYTSIESMLYQWFEEEGLFPGKLGRGEVQDLAEKVSDMILPFRSFYRATRGWEGYDLAKCLEEAKLAEDEHEGARKT